MLIVMVAGEASGDILGAGLMAALQQHYPDAVFKGIGGEKMQALGFESLFSMDRLSVMGFVEPLKRLPELLHIRKSIKQLCANEKPTLFVGIDSPDFNLNIEKFCKAQGIASVHYVSPSVWAWRQGRIKGIRKSVDLMLCLLPFEAEFYEKNNVRVRFIGHPLADTLAIDTDTQAARAELQLSNVESSQKIIALMPGSRGSEVELLGPVFWQVAAQISSEQGALFLIPCANPMRRAQIELQLVDYQGQFSYQLFDGQSHQVMAASDAVLLASGTTALEAMLLKKPMVVCYKIANMSYAILSRLVKSEYISLPNLLAKKALVPELIQDQATIGNITQQLIPLLNNTETKNAQVKSFYALHDLLQCDASKKAAQSIVELLDERA